MAGDPRSGGPFAGGGGGNEVRERDLWDELEHEVERLTVGRPRGINFSEDFAVDRVCAALAKLRQRHCVKPDRAADGLAGARGRQEDLVGLRVELAMEEQRLRIQQAKIAEARLLASQAQEQRGKLEAELAAEEADRRGGSENQAANLQWRESALKAQLGLAGLRQEADAARAGQEASTKDISSVHEELMRIANRASDNAKSLQAAMAGTGSRGDPAGPSQVPSAQQRLATPGFRLLSDGSSVAPRVVSPLASTFQP
mmetsp:Transcript_82162/g.177449  ORF Transcript_82162/g.177449 Transcript_82162/m.177449 type:complete len:257 (+) Transcript_82162:2-772(+)